jgi:uncharacterized protein (DUF305 family)
MYAVITGILLITLCIGIMSNKCYEYFENGTPDYPCRTVLSDEEFLNHMIPHHQIAIDISNKHIHHTKNDLMMAVLRELIWTQTYEIHLMRNELQHKTENVSEMDTNQAFIPTISSITHPNVVGLTNTYCDPSFFNLHPDAHHTMGKDALTDKEYILHMIPHHQVAIDMSKMLLKHTKSDFLIYLAYRMIRTQEAEVMLLNDLLKNT